MKRVVLHSGPGKTGTSAIQHWFSNHAAELSGEGFWYPEHQLDCNGISSGNLLRVMKREDDTTLPCAKATQQLLAEFENRDEHTLLLSSEFFFKHIQALNELIPNAEFIVYVRNPIDTLESGYNQGIKRHGIKYPFMVDPRIEYGVLKNLAKLLDSSDGIHLNIRPFHTSLFRNGSVVNDLLEVLDLPFEDTSSKAINPGYSLEALEFKRMCNYFDIDDINQSLDRALQAFNQGTSNYSLLDESKQTKIRRRLRNQLADFIKTRKLQALKPLLTLDKKMERPPFHDQLLLNHQCFDAVGEYLQTSEPETWKLLTDRLQSHIPRLAPSPYFMTLTGVDQSCVSGNVDAELHALCKKLSGSSKLGTADIARELAIFEFGSGNQAMAEKYLMVALKERPCGDKIVRLVNEKFLCQPNGNPGQSDPGQSIWARITRLVQILKRDSSK
ncbi:hypothetical protein [uncultured Umboniibacter sp.]|uniref:hypothetical protein n=1 Tax=uncultured Umboniibacter sp. TaxID=1798917 RepID=UPI00260592F6|nr:hypothetical protein [uncultured Umboniibacter sp.]